jgi:hypothetical protein
MTDEHWRERSIIRTAETQANVVLILAGLYLLYYSASMILNLKIPTDTGLAKFCIVAASVCLLLRLVGLVVRKLTGIR